ncbi:hypothetical protein [Streptomyces sp. NPDC058157]|uniref:hypothetical protein n=1 Tax=Streptomyces sp. NPDC058157 TaxID=3346360 RepID=UPI0036E212BB
MVLMVWREFRTRRWLRPGWWFLLSIAGTILTAVAYVAGAFAGWGAMDIARACGEEDYDEAYASLHQDDALFPLHTMCNATHDLVPSWVNPTVAGLAALTALCVVMTAATGAARITHTLSARRDRTEQPKQREHNT